MSLGIPSVVKGDDADGVASNEPVPVSGSNSTNAYISNAAPTLPQMRTKEDHLTVGFGGERGLATASASGAMVVDFSIDGQKVAVVGVLKGWATGHIHNGQGSCAKMALGV